MPLEEQGRMRKLTIKDVAREAGVSVATASRVFTNRGTVRPELAERVVKASQDLEYTPSATARSLRRGRSHTIGLVLSDVSNPFFGKIVRGIEDEVNRRGYGVVIFNTDNTVQREALAIQRVIEMRLDGVIVSSASRERQHFGRIRREGIPLVFVNREPDDAADDCVVSDNVGGAERGVAYLIEQGHTRIAIVCAPQRYSSARRRQMGYHRALVEAGLPLLKELIVEAGDTTFESGLQSVQELLGQPSPPTAIFVTNNNLTLGVVTGLRRAGLCIPEEVAVLGFDNPEWASLFGLSAVMQSTYELGVNAALLLIKRMEGFQGEPQRIVLETELVIRSSAGPQRQDNGRGELIAPLSGGSAN